MTASSFTPDLLPSEDTASQTQFTKFWQSFENNFLMCPSFPLGADVFPTDFLQNILSLNQSYFYMEK